MNTEDEVIDHFGRVLDGGDSKTLLLRRLVGRSFRCTNEVSVGLRTSKGEDENFDPPRIISKCRGLYLVLQDQSGVNPIILIICSI